MWITSEPWFFDQLKRLSEADRDRVETMVNTLLKQFPGLYEELAISALDAGLLSQHECAEKLGLTELQTESELRGYRQSKIGIVAASIECGTSPAKVADGQVSVWGNRQGVQTIRFHGSPFGGLSCPR